MQSFGKVLVLGLGLVATEARAQQQGPYIWGIGVKVGTSIIPGLYPGAFPARIGNYDFIDEEDPNGGATEGDLKNRDLDPDTGEPRYSTLQRVGLDGRFGLEGFYGINPLNRVGAGVGLGTGRDYFDAWFTLNYDRVLTKQGTFGVVAGGQIGYGSMRFDGDEELTGGDEEYLLVPYYPLRVRSEAQFMGKTSMLGVGAFVQGAIPARTVYVDLDGVEQPAVGGIGNFLLNFMAGVEIDVQFGDFVPPKPKPPKGSPKGKGGKAATPVKPG